MAAQYETVVQFREMTPRTFSPDPDTHRGRKRDRSLTRCDLEATHHGGTGESSTLRGRPRRRSTSPVVSLSRASSRAIPSSSVPSRSRSPNHQQAPRRRRHRTRSRSRTHTNEVYQAKDQLPRPIQEPLHKKGNKSAQD
ncbi:hypothetical protein LZ30DRAFT_88059 [Colletotrichum cereale]|nr:hypothetical protein LZ30DRAFT_88059 [Colletotrichum cereale]